MLRMAKKVPPTRFPNAAVVGYARVLKQLVREMGSGILDVFDNQIAEHLKEMDRYDSLEERADGPIGSILNAFVLITNLSNGIFDAYIVTQVATDNIRILDRASDKNAAAQAKVMAVNPLSKNEKLSDFMQASVQENVSYITKLKDDHLTAIERIVLQGAKKGVTAKEIRSEIVAQTGMTQNRAQFLATDQMGTIFGQLTAERHKSMGLEKFIWRTSNDERVRESHEKLDGKEFSYSELPPEGLPGEDYACRCVAEPVFD